MAKDSAGFSTKLKQFGYSDSMIAAVWPSWWSEDAEGSASAQLDLRFSVARKLGLDPRALLLEEDQPTFVWKDEAKFKRLRSESVIEQAAITSFGVALARTLVAATEEAFSLQGVRAKDLRSSILGNGHFVRLTDLLALCWGLGIPVVHLRVFPLPAKQMCAMSVRIDNRFAILLGQDANYPAPVAFYLAHELAHIAAAKQEARRMPARFACPRGA
jgi:hypothetical protein